jgi:hypothetical protein
LKLSSVSCLDITLSIDFYTLFLTEGRKLNLPWYGDELEDVEADIDEDCADEIGLQHLVSLLAVSLL